METIRSCTSSVRVNTRGLPGDRHKGKKAYTRESSWHPSGPLIPGDALDAGRADTRRLLRLPPRAASHPSVLTTPLAGATAAPDTARPLSESRHDRSTRLPWLAYRGASASRSPCRGWAAAGGGAGVCSYGADKSCDTSEITPAAGVTRLRPYRAWRPDDRWRPHAGGGRG
jgi:hypothetical protein